MPPDAVRVLAPAKLNLTLEITGRRPDGFHDLVSVMHALSVADEVLVRVSDEPGLTCSEPALAGSANLAWRAVEAMAARHRRPANVAVAVEKRVPVAAGLGGGSSDAAAVIRGLCRLWDLPFTPERYVDLAAALGSDVPFFLYGGAALVTGRGERVEPLPSAPAVWALLVFGEHEIAGKTGTLFRRLGPRHWGDGSLARKLIEVWPEVVPFSNLTGLTNSFEAIAAEVFADYEDRRCRLLAAGAPSAHLSGAGPTLFSLFATQAEALAVAARLASSARVTLAVGALAPIPPVEPVDLTTGSLSL